MTPGFEIEVMASQEAGKRLPLLGTYQQYTCTLPRGKVHVHKKVADDEIHRVLLFFISNSLLSLGLF